MTIARNAIQKDTDIVEESAELKELEDRAHAKHVLLSSEAIRHFLAACPKEIERVAFLDRVITDAKVTYPSEDGWVALNQTRMETLCKKRQELNERPFTPSAVTGPEQKPVHEESLHGIGSLAEAIVIGNVQAAYQLIEDRPMVALADAATDLDALYRMQQGDYVADAKVSEMLKESVKPLTPETLQKIIFALTGSIDGTYTDEVSAVKVAVMKAIAIVSK